jgi:predicted O-linked N-acetylglucosamine transferase (SPINDLY family)
LDDEAIGTLWRQGRLQEVASACERRLASDPQDAWALNLLGATHSQRQQHAEAIDCLTRAVELRADDSLFRSNLGNALKAAGRLGEAIECYRRAVSLRPDYADGWYNLGTALLQKGGLTEAIEAYRRVLALRPDHTAALYNLGNALRESGRPREAAESYKQALATAPSLVQALNNLGALHQEEGRQAEALECFTRALALAPQYAEAHNSLGAAHLEAGRAAQAIESLGRATALNPHLAEAHYQLGNAQRADGRLEEAITSYGRALAVRPTLAAAAAERVYTMLRAAHWDGLDERVAQLLELAAAGHPIAPFVLLHVTDDPQLLQSCAQAHARAKAVDTPPLWTGERYSHARIRVAYLSADFRDHPVGTSIVELLERHDQNALEVVLVALAPIGADPTGMRLRNAASRVLDAQGMSHAHVAAWLHQERIDIVVDLMGYTAQSRPRILAHRPAPIAVSYLGYPGTLGAPWVDHLLADAVVVPESEERYYDEQVLRIDGTLMPADTRIIAGPVATRSALGLPERGFVFCCFNHQGKISPTLFDVWLRLLQQVPGSVLWLQQNSPGARERLALQAARRGIEPARLRFAPRVADRSQYLARLAVADLFLDTSPYNAHSTARDALWAGLPVLTCLGRNFAARVSASVIRAAGLETMVTTSLEEYERAALALARESEPLRAARLHLEASLAAGQLFDTAKLCAQIETIYRRLIARQRAR